MDRLHHIALTVGDIPAALAWYREHFSVSTVYADHTWALLQLANIQLALVLPGMHPPHIAIERTNAENYGELVSHRDGTASLYIPDPWGNTLEILKSADGTAENV